ncbi:hypothetical protein BK643_05900 [Pseudomonas protegens]|nr:hypothetical protein BK643_05900 [Pseudomonas protegens]
MRIGQIEWKWILQFAVEKNLFRVVSYKAFSAIELLGRLLYRPPVPATPCKVDFTVRLEFNMPFIREKN